ncbi:hypothetical protein VE02_09997 [Pseudogymnoascus sp. 03VT05]|nr:hypothetical protein VE02_09997 [Pseudogymnoascus sp. 03VT05]
MTYDLHGQWDYAHPFSDAGCPGGNCFQSHVNLTETLGALSMVTKAGVPSNKVVVGVTSYGRPLAGAYLGPCTNTSGYIGNAEIADIIAGTATLRAVDGSIVEVTGNVQSYRDDSYSDIVVYDDTQWIAYMADDNKAIRTQVYAAYNFGGTTDWAVDLQTFVGDAGNWPRASNGQCKGSDCVDGQCVGTACISLGCDGPGCVAGVCTTTNCTSKACAGSNCVSGVCSGPGCKTVGCSGPDCGADGKCTDSNCVSLGCSGEDCDAATGICSGIDCGKSACGGRSCQNGVCEGGSASC